MVYYFDTSFIAACYINEDYTEAARAVYESLPEGTFSFSRWTIAEFASLLALRVRLGEFSEQDADNIFFYFNLEAKRQLIETTSKDFILATELLLTKPALGLRTPDAFHLAIAANRTMMLYTLDRKFLHAARTLGYAASDAAILSE